MKTYLVCFICCLTLAACVTKEEVTLKFETNKTPAPAPLIRGALSGQRQEIFAVYNNSYDCATLGYPTMKVAIPPSHGQVAVEKGTVVAAYPQSDPRRACNGKPVPATLIYYISEPNFVGTDSVAFDRIGVQGGYGYYVFSINVR